MFAIIETGGKQYKVSAGQKLKIEKIDAEEGAKFIFDKVLLVAEHISGNQQENQRESANEIKIGAPYVEGAKVEAKILRQGRERKKIVFRYRQKTRETKKKGHRQHFTEVEVIKINE